MTVLVLESRPHWVPELRRTLAPNAVPVRACRSLDDTLRAAALLAAPCLLLVDLSVTPQSILHWLGSRKASERRHPVIAYASGRLADLEWILRDLGVEALLSDRSTTTEMAAVCRRQWQAARENR